MIDFAYDGLSGLHWAVTSSYNVIILDVMPPGIDGYTLCRRLRHDAQLTTSILILTARDELTDKIEGFEAGTDDYLVKPFALPELYHRLLALARRRSNFATIRCDDWGIQSHLAPGNPTERIH